MGFKIKLLSPYLGATLRAGFYQPFSSEVSTRTVLEGQLNPIFLESVIQKYKNVLIAKGEVRYESE